MQSIVIVDWISWATQYLRIISPNVCSCSCSHTLTYIFYILTMYLRMYLLYTGTVTASKQAVNAMATNSSCVFTGQADRKVKIWRASLWSVYVLPYGQLKSFELLLLLFLLYTIYVQCLSISPWCLCPTTFIIDQVVPVLCCFYLTPAHVLLNSNVWALIPAHVPTLLCVHVCCVF